jgi:hypothetical protein
MSETTPEEVQQEVVPTPEEEATDESTGADSVADTDTAGSQDS